MSAAMNKDSRSSVESIAKMIAEHKPGHSLAQDFYTDLEIYKLEVERIINRSWIFAGHISQIAAPGDFRVLNVGQESAIVVRSKTGTLNAFANVCRHRGSIYNPLPKGLDL